MRNGQNKRMRGRNRGGGGGKGQNPLTRVYESNGPDVKIRGTASHIAEKYMQLARDAQASGDPVAAENYFQHAEHYFRLIAAAQEQFRQANPYYQQQQAPGQMQGAADVQEDFEEGDGEPIGQPGFAQGGAEQPQFGTRDPQPYLPRDAQFFQPRDQQGGGYGGGRQQQPRNDGDIDRLPSFITGGGPQPSPQGQAGGGTGGHPGYGANGYENGQGNGQGQGGGERGERGDRFHRRRRRHRGPRPDNMAGQGAGDGGDDAPRGE
jgi:Domain of unknown function (DUF4167)